ncbi:MAG TPA: ABC transporter permease [Steroidobacteraceae bacterium]|jgi:peptide/nickel transport system permease protein|nr:ABC transporter permease [Steroidobacteraceae bacterium]
MSAASDLSGGVSRWLLRKLFGMLLTMLAVSFLVFAVLELNVDDVAVKVLGQFSTADQRHAWLVQNGYTAPFLWRYLRWIGEFVTGHWGTSTYYREDVLTLIAPRLAASGLLAGAALLVIVPLGLVMGVIAGMREGSFVDRLVSVFAVVTTSIPEFASAVFLTSLFVFWLGWLPGVSTMADGFHLRELVLPVSVLTLYSAGYVARMTRSSMVEVMQSPYIRTARLKGNSMRRIIVRHALRNALITPVTVIMLQIPWLMSGVIVVEVFFAYQGFGTLLYQAALNTDIYLIEACTMISVVVVVLTQVASDLLYTWLNPRMSIRTARTAAGAK